jgi:hypothetical protein
MKLYADKLKTERSFVEGDWVFLRLKLYCQKTIAMRSNLKLFPRFYGPFQVIKKIGLVAYKLNLPVDVKIHPVFHVSCLKKKLGSHVSPLSVLPPMDANGELMFEPKAVLNHRMCKVANRVVTEVLMHWRGMTKEDSTWELLYDLQWDYPHLVGKVF